ncbi:MAG: aminotransferase class IV [Alphaproteobacteria bacterium]|nr:aminotransferase class IV [Alphaproteobacteria bacterium]
MQYIYVNKQYLPADAPLVTADDRSFRFGDGIFETILVAGGRMWDAPAHFTRLRNGLDYFRMALDISRLQADCCALIAKNNCQSGYVRVIVSRGANGPGAIGYMPGEGAPYYIIQTVEKPFPAFGSVKLWVSGHRASLHIPCKVNSAMLYTLAMMEARDNACDNALILDAHGHVCETASGNLFWVKNDVLYTPESSLPFVPGTVRERIIELSPLPVRQGIYTLADLAAAAEIFMTNIGGLVTRVSSIVPLGFSAKSETITTQLRSLLEAQIKTP